MDQKEQMKKNLIEEINSYYDHYVYMADVMAVHNHMQSYVNSNSQILEIAPNFFRIVYAATIDSYMLTFARVYDNSKQAKSIVNLISKCKESSSLFDNMKEEVEKRLTDFESRIKTDEILAPAIDLIKHRRDKIFAHNDEKYFIHPEKDNSYLPMYALWFLSSFTKEVLLYLLEALGEKPIKETIYDKDFENLLNNLPQTI